jgi:fluoride exporter
VTGLLVVAAGGVGAGLRFTVAEWVTRRVETDLPWGTAVVNGIGVFLLGLVVGSGASGSALAAATGFTSGFTTYSTWMVESVSLWEEGRAGRAPAFINWFGTFVVGLGLGWAGWAIGSALG